MGIAYLGIGSGGALVPLLSAEFEKNLGWHQALSLIGVLVILIALPLAFFIKDPKNDSPRKEKETNLPIGSIIRNPYFYLLALGSMCSIGAVAGVGQHMKLYLRDLSFTQTDAAHVMSVILLSSLAGRILMGFLSDLIKRKYVMILIYLIVASVIPLLLLPDFQGRIYLFAVIFGIGLGGDYMIIPLMAGDLFGVRALGRTMGIVLVADGIAEALFPMLVGAMHDASKSYTNGFILLIALATLGAFIVSFLPGTRPTTNPSKT